MYKGESKDFQLFIDDKPTKFRDQVEHGFTPIKQPYERHWKAWDMKFEANQTQLVEVRYSNPPSEGFNQDMAYYGRYPFYQNKIETDFDYDLADYGYGKSQMLSDWAKIKEMEYILVSGSYWKGPIERCHVEADVEAISTDGMISIFPPPHSFSSKRIMWQWNNVEPTSNVRFRFMSASPQREIMPYLRKITRNNPTDEPLKRTLELMEHDFAADGEIRKFQKLLKRD